MFDDIELSQWNEEMDEVVDTRCWRTESINLSFMVYAVQRRTVISTRNWSIDEYTRFVVYANEENDVCVIRPSIGMRCWFTTPSGVYNM